MDLGHEVYHYGLEGSDTACTKHIDILQERERQSLFGDINPANVCYTSKPMSWNNQDEHWQVFNDRTSYWIKRNLQKKDFICVIGGSCQQPLIERLKGSEHLFLTVEYGIGYNGTFAPFRVFDSYAHMHRIYGAENGHKDPDGRNFDAVIPCPYDLDDFEYNGSPTGCALPGYKNPQSYFLFVGRMIDRKGVDIAVEATRRAGVKLVLCGQDAQQKGNIIAANDGGIYTGDHLHYIGHVDTKERNKWMRNAQAILVPTKYLEPFGGVNVEAQLCGTPAITSDFGAFPETVNHGETGYRCRTLEQWVWAIQNAHTLDRKKIATRARTNYSMKQVGSMYQEYFDMLYTLWDKGWYEEKERTQLDWLARS